MGKSDGIAPPVRTIQGQVGIVDSLSSIGILGNVFGSIAIPAVLLLGVARLTAHLRGQRQEAESTRQLMKAQADALEEQAKALKKHEMASIAQTQLAAQNAVISVISSKISHEMEMISFYAGQLGRVADRPRGDGRSLALSEVPVGPDGSTITPDEIRRRLRECGERLQHHRDELDEARDLAVEISLMLMSFYEKR
ncbi:MAG: hypothetical protein QG572_1453 [Pseudomonadota bacterium]|jgi:hypothetical protein|nr:hypothetical protein [Pseudomonadota bacterium]MDQ5942637.1 hypothetical protein [Pseudomonadota bacterium]